VCTLRLRYTYSLARSCAGHSTGALDLVRLTALMDLTRGSPEVRIGLIDGPVARDHADLAESPIQEIPIKEGGASCQNSKSSACLHGTFLAGILSARRGSDAPAICPACTLLVRPIFSEGGAELKYEPSTNPDELAAAVFDCIGAGARIINLSLALVRPSTGTDRRLRSTPRAGHIRWSRRLRRPARPSAKPGSIRLASIIACTMSAKG
jgi:hypothetical protein